MPGFILHMTASQMLFESRKANVDRNAFEVGNLIPDSVSDKTYSHFRHPSRQKKLMVYPDLNLFLNKYHHLLDDSSCLGYYFHLYVDRIYAKEYIPKIVSFHNADGLEVSDREDITHARIRRTGELLPVQVFFSNDYYYGDFTKLNTYLMKRFNLSVNLRKDVANPGIEEVNYNNITTIEEQLKSYLNVPEDAANTLRVFETEDFLDFLKETANRFADTVPY